MTVLSLPTPVFTLVRRLVTVVSAFGISGNYILSLPACPPAPQEIQRHRRSHIPGRALYYSGHGNVPQRRWISTQEGSKTQDACNSKECSPPDVPKLAPDAETEAEPSDIIHQLLQNPVLYSPLRKPRNPIVLCHGLYGFDVRGPSSFPVLQMHYWSNVLNILRNKVGAEVIVTSVPPTGSVAERAENLHKLLAEKVPQQDINLMAHSMGGLDCRQLITHIKPREYTPASLTCIATPHRGSPFMDWCAENIGLGKLGRQQREEAILKNTSTPSTSEVVSEASSKRRDKAKKGKDGSSAVSSIASLPSSFTTYLLAILDSPAYANLTSHFLTTHFNPSTPDSPHVKYLSVAGRTDSVNVWHPFWFTKLVVDAWERKERKRLREEGYPPELWADDREWGNDGLVTIQSAKWGEFLGVIEGTDHWEIRGARGIELDVDLKLGALTKGIDLSIGLAGLGLGSAGESLKDWDWGKFIRAWRKEERKEEKRENGSRATKTTVEEGKDLANAKTMTKTTVETSATSSDMPKGGVITKREKTAEEKEKDDIIRASTEKLSAVFDWIVDHVPTESIAKLSSTVTNIELTPSSGSGASAKEGTDRKGEKNELATKEDLERFYVALARKLYDEGL